DELGPDHLLQAGDAMRASKAACFHATVGRFADAEAGDSVVDHHSAGLQLRRDAFTPCGLARPHARRQTEFRVVGEAHGFGFVRDGHDGQSRTKSFFAHDAHGVVHVGEYGRRVEVRTQLGEALAAGQELSPPGDGVVYLLFDDLQLAFMDERANIRIAIESVADL